MRQSRCMRRDAALAPLVAWLVLATLLLVLWSASSADAGKPSLTVSVKNGEYSGLSGLDPRVRWTTDGRVGGFLYELGADLSINPADIVGGGSSGGDDSPSPLSLPKSTYGKIGRTLGRGWAASARADVDLAGPAVDSVDLDLRVDKDDWDLSLAATGTVSKRRSSCSVGAFQARKGWSSVLGLAGSKLSVLPRFDARSRTGELLLSCEVGSTRVALSASSDGAAGCTVSQRIAERTIVTPSFSIAAPDDAAAANANNRNKFALQLQRLLDDDKSISATITPNDSIAVQWTDGAWVADFDAPLSGINLDSVSVKVKRKIEFH